jgi:hypothetical protein
MDAAETNMTLAQQDALKRLCDDYSVEFAPSNFFHPFDLPSGWVAGQVGPLYVGCDPEGHIHS